MQQVGAMTLPPTPVGVALPVGIDPYQLVVQAVRKKPRMPPPEATRQWKRMAPPA